MNSNNYTAILLASLSRLGAALGLTMLGVAASHGAPRDYFTIEVVDDSTGRGVPLVQLTTVNSVSFWTDSNGLIAFLEPALMGQEVFFHVRSHGYEYAKDFFDNRGLKLRPVAGGKAVIKLKRLNIAERLYRITGEGIYRDTVLLGRRPPTKAPLLNGQVMGQDTVIATPYRGKIFWFWGDTDRPSYPLGNFGASGATSELPGRGGFDPGVGLDLAYFTDKAGFSKPMCPNASFGKGLKWIEGLMTLCDERGRERLLARVAAGTGLDKTRDWHLAIFNDEQQVFESLARWDIHDTHDSAHPFRARAGTNDYFYLYPNYRVRADLASLTNLAAYEAFTCLAPGACYDGGASRLNRSPNGPLRYEWRASADRLDGSRLRELIKTGLLKPDEAWVQLHDVESGRPIQVDRGSVCWNEYRRRWVLIGSGQPGDIWFAEADTPLGPWVYARRVVAHDRYNFYNPTQHVFFDQDGGRVIYFEGTYTASFSGATHKTPRYDYNQIMYRLALDDPRLDLPAPVYATLQPGGRTRLMMRPDIEAARAWNLIESLPFFAVPISRPRQDLIPVYAVMEESGMVLRRDRPTDHKVQPLFFALPPATNISATPKPADSAPAITSLVVPLREYRRVRDGQRLYSTRTDLADSEQQASPEPLCRVWRNPMSVLILDADATAWPTPGRH
ncbi:MAG TPA: hypothetical protein VFT34_02410 [Verrucomicrobiae bacterium]|nr:hypothetical protein [Verrucomicrobiae bacterium]